MITRNIGMAVSWNLPEWVSLRTLQNIGGRPRAPDVIKRIVEKAQEDRPSLFAACVKAIGRKSQNVLVHMPSQTNAVVFSTSDFPEPLCKLTLGGVVDTTDVFAIASDTHSSQSTRNDINYVVSDRISRNDRETCRQFVDSVRREWTARERAQEISKSRMSDTVADAVTHFTHAIKLQGDIFFVPAKKIVTWREIANGLSKLPLTVVEFDVTHPSSASTFVEQRVSEALSFIANEVKKLPTQKDQKASVLYLSKPETYLATYEDLFDNESITKSGIEALRAVVSASLLAIEDI